MADAAVSANRRMFRITLICDGIPAELGVPVASDVTEEFTHRPWHHNVRCTWAQGQLTLVADNDFDPKGEALADEFSDAVSACTKSIGYRIRIEHVVELSATVLKPIGWWVTPETAFDLPAPQELVKDLLPSDRAAVAEYLANGLRLVRFRGYSWCRFSCGIEESDMGSWDLTDGIWVWPEGLAHYVDIHNVGLPEDFTRHALAEPIATMPTESPQYDDGYWIQWCAIHRAPGIRDGILDALAKSDVELSIPPSQRIEALELERGTTVEKCPWSCCTRAALVGSKICAEHYLDQNSSALLEINRFKALRAYLEQLPASPRNV